MNWTAWFAAGFGGTVLLTTALAASQGLGLTRINIPYLLGTMATADRDRASVLGIAMHLVNGLLFSLVYVVAFHAMGRSDWWLGGAIGLAHGLFVVAVAVPALPGLHPRMASETTGPGEERLLEPPGFLARNYGNGTPVSILVSHVLFGVVLGVIYGVP
jgi:uncharacterized membrane protein YagU involved in acid resistance